MLLARNRVQDSKQIFLPANTGDTVIASYDILQYGPLALVQATAFFTGYDPNGLTVFDSAGLNFSGQVNAAGTLFLGINESTKFGDIAAGVNPAFASLAAATPNFNVIVRNPSVGLDQNLAIQWSWAVFLAGDLENIPT